MRNVLHAFASTYFMFTAAKGENRIMKVMITGTSSGIGKAVAEKFLYENHSVIGFDRNGASIVHPSYRHIVCDITQELPDISDVEILVNNAGVQNENDIEVNLIGNMKVTEKYAFQEHIKSVLFMASASAHNGSEFPEYAASKGGILAYSKNAALRLAPFGATCNSISAGGVITPINDHILNDETLMEAVLNETLLHKWAAPEEIADLAYYLTVINKSITGQDVLIDNGEMLKSNFIW